MDKATKVLLNSLRCPVCAGQIDMFDGKALVPRVKINYACAANYKHYGIWLEMDGLLPAYIEEETVEVIDGNHLYVVIQYHNRFIQKHWTSILVMDINGDGNIIEKKLPKEIKFKKSLFDFTKTNKVKLLNRVKTVLVFQ